MLRYFGIVLTIVGIAFGGANSCVKEEFYKNSSTNVRLAHLLYPHRFHGNSTERELLSVEIVCGNITAIRDINYTYEEENYEHFLKVIDSNVSVLHPEDFLKFATITRLFLNQIHLEKISPGAFSGLIKLKELSLSDNELSEVTNGTFSNLSSLEVLNLTNNNIHRIDYYTFMGTVNLRKFYLRQNYLSEITTEALKVLRNLDTLDVSRNPLTTFSFNDWIHVETLNLSETFLSIISYDGHHDLSNSTIENLNLSNCHLTEVNFANFPPLSNLDLSLNKIEQVENCNRLQISEVNLDHNKISTIEETFFGLQKFSASHNNFQVLDGMFNDPTFIWDLNFGYNQISNISRTFFRNMSNLHKLILKHNKIKQVNTGLFIDLRNLILLDLSSNQIEHFEMGTFDGLTELKILNISNNKLLDLHQYTLHPLGRLRKLYFHDNKISSFDVKNLKAQHPFLSRISLNNNPWICENLVKTEQLLRTFGIEVLPGYSYNVDNYGGVACINPKKVISKSTPTSVDDIIKIFQKIVDDSANTALERYLDEDFGKLKCVHYFDKGHGQGNLLKNLDNYKSELKNQSDFQKAPTQINAISIFCLVLLFLITVLQGLIAYFIYSFIKALKNKNSTSFKSSAIELL